MYTGTREQFISGTNSNHHGEWHIAYNCIKRGNVVCGYAGFTPVRDHWSCCMSEDKYSSCVRHTGFWHAMCNGAKCDRDTCYCGRCGGGCTYSGNKGHWSCCHNENLYTKNCH